MWFPSNRSAKHVHWQSWSDSNFDSHHGFPTCIDQISTTGLGQLPLLHSHTANQLRCTAHKMCTVVIGMGPAWLRCMHGWGMHICIVDKQCVPLSFAHPVFIFDVLLVGWK